jgi:NitT/TauT family transport system substrate-binding protein
MRKGRQVGGLPWRIGSQGRPAAAGIEEECVISKPYFAAFCRLALALAGLCLTTPGQALDTVTFGTNWLAEAEHGGFYQAVVDGTYEKFGLAVKILPGGPQANNRLLLATGKIDFYMGANLIQAFSALEQQVPTEVVAAIFQKDPQILMSHPGQGLDKWDDLTKATAFISKEGLASYYRWMRADYGFSEARVKPYTFNAAPFIADKASIQQGYLTSEPFEVERQGGFKPNIFLLADYGFDTYATTIEARKATVASRPDLVRRFVDASIIGWYHYLYGDNSQANAAIKRDNPDMTDAQIGFSLAKLRDYGIVDSGETLSNGIGAMNEARIKSFYDKMVKAGVVPAGLDYRQAVVLQFVNHGVGLDLHKP